MSNHVEPRFSVVMSVSDQARELEQNLPLFLEQDYEPGYEVVVVDESSTDGTDDILNLLVSQSPRLYSTFLPKYTPNESRPKMALSIGVKAAKFEWLILADVTMPPPSPEFLKELATALDSNTTLILGYVNRKDGSLKLQSYIDYLQARPLIVKAERKNGNGHSGKLFRQLRGKYDFLVTAAAQGHDVLRLFECNVSGWQLLRLRLSVLLHNLTH